MVSVVHDRDADAPSGCDGWGSADPAADLVVFYGSSPVTDGPLTVVEESGETTECIALDRAGRKVWFAFGRHDGAPKQLIGKRADGSEPVVARLHAWTDEDFARMERESRDRERSRREAASWRSGPLPDVGGDWDLITVSPGEVNDESMHFCCVAFTLRRRHPRAFVHLYVEWFDEWPAFEPWSHFFDASPLSRVIHELGLIGLAERDVFEAWTEWVANQPEYFDDDEAVDPDDEGGIAPTGRIVLDGAARTEHRWNLGSVAYAGIEWTDAISVEVITAGIDLDEVLRGIRNADDHGVDEFVAAHSVEHEGWDPDWWAADESR